MQKQQGKLLIIDGPSGSGKDSLISAFVTKLNSRGELSFLLSEDALDEKRNEILEARERGKNLGGSGDKEMAMVLVEHRSDIYKRFANPYLDAGYTVIANRGEPATLAYQTARKELTMKEIWDMHRKHGIPKPNLVVLTTCSARTALQREESDKATSQVRSEREAGHGLSGKVTQEVGASEIEKLKRRESIHAQYEATKRFLEGKRVPVLSLDTEKMTVLEEVDTILNLILPSEE